MWQARSLLILYTPYIVIKESLSPVSLTVYENPAELAQIDEQRADRKELHGHVDGLPNQIHCTDQPNLQKGL
jgi:hypothetical protein